jgi:hypothetical protein
MTRLRIRISRNSILTYSPDGLRDTGKFRQLPVDAWEFLDCLADDDATHVVEARNGRQLVGWLRVTKTRGGLLYAQGTWVSAVYRRQGIAQQLWGRALKALKPKVIEVSTVSEGGRALVRRLRDQHPHVMFDAVG